MKYTWFFTIYHAIAKKICTGSGLSQIPALSSAVFLWKRLKGIGWREDHIPEWDIQALYNLELIDAPESPHSTLSKWSNEMMKYLALAVKFCYLHRRTHWQSSPSAPLDLLLQHGAKGRHSHHHIFLISCVSSQSFVNRICFPRTPPRSIYKIVTLNKHI